jgi:hypothetical protein
LIELSTYAGNKLIQYDEYQITYWK